MKSTLSIVIFACEGREHLLRKTWASFRPNFSGVPVRKILAIDGHISLGEIEAISPDIVVQNFRRRGYVTSIQNALAQTTSEFFFWLEDDWIANQKLEVESAISLLRKHPSWLQIRWSKIGQLSESDYMLSPGVRYSSVGFSANPAICRTAETQAGFESIVHGATNGLSSDARNFENELINWAHANNRVCAVFETDGTPAVSHIGYLERTGRQWHTVNSLQRQPEEFLFSMGRPPQLRRRVWMMAKLLGVMVDLSMRQFRDNGAYELAFRIVVTLQAYIRERSSTPS